MLKRYWTLSFLTLFLISCGSKEVITYIDKPVLVFPSQALLEAERIPVIQGDDIRALIDWSLDLRQSLNKSNQKLLKISEWKESLQRDQTRKPLQE